MTASTKGNAIRRTLTLVSALLKGETLDRDDAAKLIGTKGPAAYDQLLAIRKHLPGVQLERGGRQQRFRFDLGRHLGATESSVLVAACFGAAVSPLFEGSSYEEGLRASFRELLRRARKPELFDLHQQKFTFVRRGGDEVLTQRPSLLEQVVLALLENRRLHLNYRGGDGKKKNATVAPLSIMLYQHQYYLAARRDDGVIYPYRLSRVLNAKALKSTFGYPRDFSPQSLFEHSFGVHIANDEPVVHVRIRLHGFWARYADTHRWHPTQQNGPLINDSRIVAIRVRCCPELETWILSLADLGEVLEPEDLRVRVTARIARAATIYGRDSNGRLRSDASRPPGPIKSRPAALPKHKLGEG